VIKEVEILGGGDFGTIAAFLRALVDGVPHFGEQCENDTGQYR